MFSVQKNKNPRYNSYQISQLFHCKALSTLSQKSETVAQKWDRRRKRRDNGDSLTFLRQCGQALRMHQNLSAEASL